MAQAEDLLTPSTLWMLEHGMPMQIIETKKVHWPKAYREATEKYSAQVKLSADGKAIHQYVAGCPFPNIDVNDPLAGHKIMWNYEQKLYDNAGTEYITELVNSKGEVERSIANRWRRMMWIGRLHLKPKPSLPHNPAIRYTDLLGPVSGSSGSERGTLSLYIRYLSPDVPDNLYLYKPGSRRLSLKNNLNRGDVAWGEMDLDSSWGFYGKLSLWTFRVLAEKDILAVVHSGKYGDPSVWCAPRDGKHGILAALPCVPWEKRKVWVVEGTPTGYRGHYPYSKRILYMDQDFFGVVLTEMYDEQGELWKYFVPCLFYTQKPYEGYPAQPLKGGKYEYEDEWPFIPNGVMVDMQKVRATTLEAPSVSAKPRQWRHEWYFNEAVSSNTPRTYRVSSNSR
jgi:hypothetical protein